MATRRKTEGGGGGRTKEQTAAGDSAPSTRRKLRVAFLHPNLGIGGAERLVVDCASALRQRGHSVHLFTNYHDPHHCYDETRDGSLPVTVYGQTRDSLFGRFRVLVAIARMIYLSLVFALWHARKFDVVVVDQVAHAVPLLRWTTKCKILFYCHFPDQLLSAPGGLLKRLYRLPVDRAEEWATGRAHLLLVNSRFTLATMAATFPSLRERVERGEVGVLYPSIDFARYAELNAVDDAREEQRDEVCLLDRIMFGETNGAAAAYSSAARKGAKTASSSSSQSASAARCPRLHLLTSINRFERKKNLPLAVHAFALYHQQQREKQQQQSKQSTGADGASPPAALPALPVSLLLCGGFDPVNVENREHFAELRALCSTLGLRHREMENRRGEDGRVRLVWADADADAGADGVAESDDAPVVYFLRSFTDAQRSYLLSHSLCVLYTPSNEHFGIVPVEAQFMRRPVLACASGGPLESVVPLQLDEAAGLDDAAASTSATGFLCEPQPALWSRAICALVQSEERSRTAAGTSLSLARRLGSNGRANVLSKFHFTHFQQQLEQHIATLTLGLAPSAAACDHAAAGDRR